MIKIGKTACRRTADLGLIVFVLILSLPGSTPAQSPGITATEILIGQSCALTGPYQAMGKGMRDGALAYFRHVNAAGGINGRKIKLITLDDGYTANASIVNTRRLLVGEKVFLLFGYVGAPASRAAIALCVEKKVPFFSSVSGAGFLRTPVNRYVFNTRASNRQEIEALVTRFVADRGGRKFAVCHPDNDFGNAGLEGVRRALAEHSLEVEHAAAYKAGTLDVEAAGKDLLAVRPDAVFLLGSAAPSAKLITVMRNWGSGTLFAATSATDAETLAELLAGNGLGVAVSQVVPFPYDRRIPLVAEYHRLTGRYVPESETGATGLEGFIAAKALCAILKDLPAPLTRDGFIRAAENQKAADVGGLAVTFGPDSHQGVKDVFFTQAVPGGYVKPIVNFENLYN